MFKSNKSTAAMNDIVININDVFDGNLTTCDINALPEATLKITFEDDAIDILKKDFKEGKKANDMSNFNKKLDNFLFFLLNNINDKFLFDMIRKIIASDIIIDRADLKSYEKLHERFFNAVDDTYDFIGYDYDYDDR